MSILEVLLKIPVEVDPLIGAPALTFSHWLPLGKENGIISLNDGMQVTLWFEIESTWWASQPKESDIPNRENVLTHYVNATITINDLPEYLAKFIENESIAHTMQNPDKKENSEIELLGSTIFINTISLYNRLIAYVRNNKGQYWLRSFDLDLNRLPDIYILTEAKAKINNGNWFKFKPSRKSIISINAPDHNTYIKENEWNNIKEFVNSNQKTSLVGELFSTSHQLAGNGYLRNSIIDAVTALEIVISEFKISEKANKLLASKFNERLNTKNLKNQIDHCGFSATIGFLLPLLLNENELPSEMIRQCQDAIMLRQNIIHNGQRKVNETIIYQHIRNIKRLCEILQTYI